MSGVTDRRPVAGQDVPPGTAGQKPLPRMRIERGRVMHAVERSGSNSIQSKCRNTNKYKETQPRASGPPEFWTSERYWYPDCRHCPPEES